MAIAEEADVSSGPRSVASWENLPGGGEYLPKDDHGTNWYRDGEGNNWYQNSDGTWTEYQ